ncbi:MAG: hypothetical protein ACLQPD_31445 [Desulfomonilaceae bacterium]
MIGVLPHLVMARFTGKYRNRAWVPQIGLYASVPFCKSRGHVPWDRLLASSLWHESSILFSPALRLFAHGLANPFAWLEKSSCNSAGPNRKVFVGDKEGSEANVRVGAKRTTREPLLAEPINLTETI